MNKKIILFLIGCFLLTSFTFGDKKSEEFVDKKIAEIKSRKFYPGKLPFDDIKSEFKNYKDYVLYVYEQYKKFPFPYIEASIKIDSKSTDNRLFISLLDTYVKNTEVFDEKDLKWDLMITFAIPLHQKRNKTIF